MVRFVLLLCLTLAASPALAGATPWQQLAPGVQARLISSDALSDGTTLAGLELDMPAGSETYWRIPGETGIPTQIDFSASRGLGDPQLLWPFPEIDHTGGFLDYVYHGTLVLPVRLSAGGATATLSASIALGICSDICVPAQAKFELPVDFSKPDAAQAIRLDQAVARTPIAWDQPAQPFGAVSLSTDGAGLTIAGADPSLDLTSLIADVGDPSILFETPQKSPDGNLWTLRPLGGAGAKGLEGRSVQLTFMTPMGPYAVTRKIEPAAQ
jgi:DsbC/DsbD-like thiol-disulfide interchange protein